AVSECGNYLRGDAAVCADAHRPRRGPLGLRALCAVVRPGLDQRAELFLRPWRRHAYRPRVPAVGDELVLRHVVHDLLQRLAAVSLRVLDLLADLTERTADPRHLDRRQHPLRIAGHAIEVRRAVAGEAAHAGRAHAARA